MLFVVSCTPTNTPSTNSNLDNRLFGIWQDTNTSGDQDVFSFSDDGRMAQYRYQPNSGSYSGANLFEWWTIDNMLYRVELNGSLSLVNDYEVNSNWLTLYPNTSFPFYLKKQ